MKERGPKRLWKAYEGLLGDPNRRFLLRGAVGALRAR